MEKGTAPYMSRERAILAANMAMNAGSHGLVIPTATTNSLRLTVRDFEDMLELTQA